MKYLSIFIIILFIVNNVHIPSAHALKSEGIAVVVNENAISMSNVNDRIKLILASSGLPDSPDIRQKLTPQIISELVDEQIRLQEASKLDLKVSSDEVNQGFATIAQQNKFKPDQFRTMLTKGGINVGTMEDQIRAQIAWTKVVQSKLRPQVIVSDSDVDNYLQRLNDNIGKPEYLVAEIFLPISNPSEAGKTQTLAQELVQEIRGGKAPFFKVAQQFSKSAGADKGGDLGWITQGQLQKELDDQLPKIGKGKISDPIRTASGIHILNIREQRTVSKESLPARKDVTQIIGMNRLERLQRRYLMDMKSAAYIDNRFGK